MAAEAALVAFILFLLGEVTGLVSGLGTGC
jgi:hypothetical protein